LVVEALVVIVLVLDLHLHNNHHLADNNFMVGVEVVLCHQARHLASNNK
jgi:hypothetical protein